MSLHAPPRNSEASGYRWALNSPPRRVPWAAQPAPVPPAAAGGARLCHLPTLPPGTKPSREGAVARSLRARGPAQTCSATPNQISSPLLLPALPSSPPPPRPIPVQRSRPRRAGGPPPPQRGQQPRWPLQQAAEPERRRLGTPRRLPGPRRRGPPPRPPRGRELGLRRRGALPPLSGRGPRRRRLPTRAGPPARRPPPGRPPAGL
mmetsp:Transcript_36356/g.102441  ORF Transcript_36356/g.102441 Transcript_36356/m.102441 type:complete len:205 (+) Transcript_36356:3737-4351(+)